MMRNFEPHLYIIILASLLLLAALLTVTKEDASLQSYADASFRLFSALFRQIIFTIRNSTTTVSAVRSNFRKNKFQILFMSWVWFSFYMDIAYEGALKSRMTIPKQRAYDFDTVDGAIHAMKHEVLLIFDEDLCSGF